MSRTGIGWDSHRLIQTHPPRPLVIGGMRLESEFGLDGHSDADVLTHAVIDALLGAAGLGDIGQHFPDTDPEFAGADSLGLLREAVARATAFGWKPTYADTTVIMETPKLGGARDGMRQLLAAALGIPENCVNIKATTGEGIGFVGRREGVAALAVVTVDAV